MRHLSLLLVCSISAFAGASGCSSQQFYSIGQNWQRGECNKIVDHEDRKRCLAQADTSYETYQREAETAKTAK